MPVDNLDGAWPGRPTLRRMSDRSLTVRLDELTGTAGRLRDVEDHLARAGGRVRELGPAAAGDVEQALLDFADHWARGLRDLRATVQALHDGLTAARTAYGEQEQRLADAFGRRS